MESQPQNPEFRNNPENFHQCHIRVILKSFFLKVSILCIHWNCLYEAIPRSTHNRYSA